MPQIDAPVFRKIPIGREPSPALNKTILIVLIRATSEQDHKTMNATTKIGPEKLDEVLAQARAAEADGKSGCAFELYRIALKIDPSRQSAAYRCAINLIEIGRISEAEAYLNQIRADPQGKEWLLELAMAKVRMAQFQPKEAEN